jgi:hypothetical protein
MKAAANSAGPWAGAIGPNGDSIKAVRVSAGADGQSTIADIEVPADKSVAPLLFQQFLTHKASATAIYRAPPHHAIGESAPAKDLLLIVDGSTTIKTDGGSRRLGLGTFVLFDGVARHTEKAGPAGYVAIKVRLAD